MKSVSIHCWSADILQDIQAANATPKAAGIRSKTRPVAGPASEQDDTPGKQAALRGASAVPGTRFMGHVSVAQAINHYFHLPSKHSPGFFRVFSVVMTTTMTTIPPKLYRIPTGHLMVPGFYDRQNHRKGSVHCKVSILTKSFLMTHFLLRSIINLT